MHIQFKKVTSNAKNVGPNAKKQHQTQTGKIQRKKVVYTAKGASISKYVRKGCCCNQHPTQQRTSNAKTSQRRRDALEELWVLRKRRAKPYILESLTSGFDLLASLKQGPVLSEGHAFHFPHIHEFAAYLI